MMTTKAVSPASAIKPAVQKSILPTPASTASDGTDVDPFSRPFANEFIVFVLGGPGSGKGTQCARLAKALNLTHISMGDLLRQEVAEGSPLGEEITAAMREGIMVSMDITRRLLIKNMAKAQGTSNGFLLDGFPRQLDQAEAFETTIGTCTFVLTFDCPSSVLVQRLLKRGETSGRADDNAVTIQKRLKTFETLTKPVIEHYESLGKVCRVNGNDTIEAVTERTIAAFNEMTSRLAPQFKFITPANSTSS
jgi:adenylate kinase